MGEKVIIALSCINVLLALPAFVLSFLLNDEELGSYLENNFIDPGPVLEIMHTEMALALTASLTCIMMNVVNSILFWCQEEGPNWYAICVWNCLHVVAAFGWCAMAITMFSLTTDINVQVGFCSCGICPADLCDYMARYSKWQSMVDYEGSAFLIIPFFSCCLAFAVISTVEKPEHSVSQPSIYTPVISTNTYTPPDCWRCNGTGKSICRSCDGAGYLEATLQIRTRQEVVASATRVSCTDCNGRGTSTCTRCYGRG